MELTFEVTLQYGDDEPDECEPSPTASDLSRWILEGMAAEGFSSADVCISGQ